MIENDYAQQFGRKLQFFLDKNDMSQKELAEKLGVSTSAVSSWCNGDKSPRMNKVDAMCEIFGCKRSDFIEDGDVKEGYYINPETAQMAQQLFEDKNLRVLFNAARNSRPEDLKMAADLLTRLKETNPDG